MEESSEQFSVRTAIHITLLTVVILASTLVAVGLRGLSSETKVPQSALVQQTRSSETESKAFLPVAFSGGTANYVPPTPTPTAVPEQEEPRNKEKKGVLKGVWPEEILQWEELITKYAKRAGLESDVVASVVFVESWFNPDNSAGYFRCPDGPSSMSCTSVSGAMCPMQVMPFHFGADENPRDPDTCFSKGVAILKSYIDRFGGDTYTGIAAYNCGPTGLVRGTCSSGGGYSYAAKVALTYSRYVGDELQ